MLTLLTVLAWLPFYVGPVHPGMGVVHITVWVATPAEGIAACREELSWYLPGEADCRAEPDTWAPDPSMPGWAL